MAVYDIMSVIRQFSIHLLVRTKQPIMPLLKIKHEIENNKKHTTR